MALTKRQPVALEEPLARLELGGRHVDITRVLGEIDLDNLSDEVSKAGGNAVWWGTLAARARGEHERAKATLEVIKAEIGRKSRSKRSLQEKVTERMVEEDVLLDPAYRVAVDAVIDAEERANILRAVQYAVEQKQRTLDNLAIMLARERGATQPPITTTLPSRKGH